jgi:hypothetical protein
VHLAEVKSREALRASIRKSNSGQYSGAYRRLAKIVRDNAQACHICKEGYRPNDPFEADHLYPGTEVTSIAQLAPAHRSCNIARGNKPLS